MKKLFLLIWCSGTAIAVSPSQYDYSSAYFDLGAGFGTITNLPTGTIAANVAAGYNFNRYLALEGDWTTMPSSQWGWLSNYNVYTAAVKGTLPASDRWNLYGKVGSGLGFSSWSGTLGSPAIYGSASSASSWVAQASGGVSVQLSNHFSLYLENNTYFNLNGQPGSYGTTNTTLFGFQYNFSAPRQLTSSIANDASRIDHNLPTGVKSVVILSDGTTVATVAAPPSAASCSVACHRAELKAVQPQLILNRVQTDRDDHQYVIIESGDTLYSLSKNSGVSLSTLRRINHLFNDNVVLGKRFYLN